MPRNGGHLVLCPEEPARAGLVDANLTSVLAITPCTESSAEGCCRAADAARAQPFTTARTHMLTPAPGTCTGRRIPVGPCAAHLGIAVGHAHRAVPRDLLRVLRRLALPAAVRPPRPSIKRRLGAQAAAMWRLAALCGVCSQAMSWSVCKPEWRLLLALRCVCAAAARAPARTLGSGQARSPQTSMKHSNNRHLGSRSTAAACTAAGGHERQCKLSGRLPRRRHFGHAGPYWGRQYVFWHGRRPLTLIHEVFSPALQRFLGPLSPDA